MYEQKRRCSLVNETLKTTIRLLDPLTNAATDSSLITYKPNQIKRSCKSANESHTNKFPYTQHRIHHTECSGCCPSHDQIFVLVFVRVGSTTDHIRYFESSWIERVAHILLNTNRRNFHTYSYPHHATPTQSSYSKRDAMNEGVSALIWCPSPSHQPSVL